MAEKTKSSGKVDFTEELKTELLDTVNSNLQNGTSFNKALTIFCNNHSDIEGLDVHIARYAYIKYSNEKDLEGQFINNGRWTMDEDKRFIEILKENRMYKSYSEIFNIVAKELKRRPYSVRIHFYHVLKPMLDEQERDFSNISCEEYNILGPGGKEDVKQEIMEEIRSEIKAQLTSDMNNSLDTLEKIYSAVAALDVSNLIALKTEIESLIFKKERGFLK